MRTRLLSPLFVLLAACGGTETGRRAPVDAGATADAGDPCSGTPPIYCIDFCGSDIAREPSCAAGVWSCEGNLIQSDEIDAACYGKLTGPCDNGGCELDRVCGSDDRCWLPCEASLASFTCRESTGTCCGAATATVTCAPPGGPNGCPAGSIMETECTSFEPGC